MQMRSTLYYVTMQFLMLLGPHAMHINKSLILPLADATSIALHGPRECSLEEFHHGRIMK